MRTIRSFTENDRIHLERRIIGSVLLDNNFGQVGSVLRAVNFADVRTRLIWKTFQLLWPEKPIDLVTVNQSLRLSQISWPNYLVHCVQMVNSAQHLAYWAFVLLEISMAEYFIKTSDLYMSKNANPTYHAALSEVQGAVLDANQDLLVTLNDGEKYLNTIDPDHPFSIRIREFNHNITGRAKIIKYQSAIDVLSQCIRGLYAGTELFHRQNLDKLTLVLFESISNKKVPRSMMQGINNSETL